MFSGHHCLRRWLRPSALHSEWAHGWSSSPTPTCCHAEGLESSFLPSLAGATPPVLPHRCSAPELSAPVLPLLAAQGSRFGTRREESEGWSFLILSPLLLVAEKNEQNRIVDGTPYSRHGYSVSPPSPGEFSHYYKSNSGRIAEKYMGKGPGAIGQGLTWSRNIREMISSTCRLHCCSVVELARKRSRSSRPLR